MAGGVVHVEIKVTQMARAKKFYSKLFGWKFAPMTPGYVLFNPGKGIGGALDRVKKIAKGDSSCVYFEVKAVDPALALANKLGAKTVTPKTIISGGHGVFAQIRDSESNLIGIWSKSRRDSVPQRVQK